LKTCQFEVLRNLPQQIVKNIIPDLEIAYRDLYIYNMLKLMLKPNCPINAKALLLKEEGQQLTDHINQMRS